MSKASKTLVTVVLAASIGVTCIIGCRGKEPGRVEVGAVLSMTGDVGAYGQRSLKGLQIAEDEINAAGGINGKKLSLIVEDARSSSKDAVSALQKLTEVDGMRIVVGDVLSGTTLAMAPIAERKRILLFAPGASNPSLTNAGDYIFRNWVSDDFDGKAIAHYMLENEIRDAFVLFQQTDYCVGLADAFTKEFESLGGHVNSREGFVTEATDFRAPLVKLQAVNPNAVYLVGESRQNGTILRQAREMAIRVRWFANLTVDTPECRTIAGPAREGVIFTTPAFDPNSEVAQVRRFVDAFRRKYNEDPDVTSGVAYDALMILASVVKSVGTDPARVKDALYKVRQFPGVTGATSFDANGDVMKAIFVKEIKNDQPALVKAFTF